MQIKVVVATMGLPHADAAAIRDVLESRSTSGDLALFLDTADDPVVQRILTPRIALKVAEYLVSDRPQHVLVILADMTSYCETVREISAARGEIPGGRAYLGYFYMALPTTAQAHCNAVKAAVDAAVIIRALRLIENEVLAIRRRLRGIERHRIPAFAHSLSALQLQIDELEREEQVVTRMLQETLKKELKRGRD